MPRVDAVLAHPRFMRELNRVRELERDRRFCRHGLSHLLDVARVAWIRRLEDGLGLDREVVYAAALLHDIGRAGQYDVGTPHDVAGERIAAEILGTVEGEMRFSPSEQAEILTAVRGHRRGTPQPEGELAGLIAWADHASRPCFACAARATCKWTDEEKNLQLRV